MCSEPASTELTLADVLRIQKNAENHATGLLDQIWDERYPVNVLKIAEYLDIELRQVNFPDNTVAVIIKSADDTHPTIYLDRDLTPQRRRFTIAHEIGHYIEHREIVGEDPKTAFLYDSPKIRSSEIRASRKPTHNGEPDTTSNEIFADAFAHALLMPESEVASFTGLGMELSVVAEYFGVSTTTMTNRLNQLRLTL